MRQICLKEEKERADFALRAAANFAKYPEHSVYTDAEIIPGCEIGLRWGLDNDCVLVLQFAEFVEPVLYAQVVERAAA